MKRTIALFLLLAMGFALCACGERDESTEYDDLIECIEDDDYAGALAELNKLMLVEGDQEVTVPTFQAVVINPLQEETAERTITTVEINEDNFFTYFELVTEHNWNHDAMDDAYYFNMYSYYALKEEYAERLVDMGDNKVGVELSFDKYAVPLAVDYENETFTVGTRTEGQKPEQVTKIHQAETTPWRSGSWDDLYVVSVGVAKEYYTETQKYYEIDNMSILRVNGSIELYEE